MFVCMFMCVCVWCVRNTCHNSVHTEIRGHLQESILSFQQVMGIKLGSSSLVSCSFTPLSYFISSSHTIFIRKTFLRNGS